MTESEERTRIRLTGDRTAPGAIDLDAFRAG